MVGDPTGGQLMGHTEPLSLLGDLVPKNHSKRFWGHSGAFWVR